MNYILACYQVSVWMYAYMYMYDCLNVYTIGTGILPCVTKKYLKHSICFIRSELKDRHVQECLVIVCATCSIAATMYQIREW